MAPSYLAVMSAAAAVVVAVASVQVLRVCAAFSAARRTFQSSTLPGPPLTHPIFGGYVDLVNLPGLKQAWGWHEAVRRRMTHLFRVLACLLGKGKVAGLHVCLGKAGCGSHNSMTYPDCADQCTVSQPLHTSMCCCSYPVTNAQSAYKPRPPCLQLQSLHT